MKDKIKSRKEIADIVDMLRSNGKSIVTTNGSFDIFHVGHVRYLQEAKSQGDVLIVGLNSDKSVRLWKRHIGYADWEKRPINAEESRAEILAGLESVDYVTIFDEVDCISFVESIKPDVHVNGSEYGEDCIEAATVKKYGGRLHIVRIHQGFSTSDLIKRILDAYK
jgi:rfaE bifunctional protein nucleotidyltransferase chain/domain